MRYSFILLLFFTFAAGAQNQNRCCIPLKEELSVKQLGHEFQQLRKFRSTDCCRKNFSRMMEVLDRLQDSIGKDLTPAQIKHIMGQPDFVQMPDGLNLQPNPGERIMGYYWRTTDFLYFTFKNGRLVGNNWFHAYE